jgi:hypothetical protein
VFRNHLDILIYFFDSGDRRASLTLASVALWTPAMARQPTATEAFNLRSRCAELGQKVLEDKIRGNNEAIISQASRYDPRTNRCYVDLIVRTVDPTRPPSLFHRFLFDGQTKEMLAEASIYNDNKRGQVLDKHHIRKNSDNDGWDDAKQYIDQMMAEDRR